MLLQLSMIWRMLIAEPDDTAQFVVTHCTLTPLNMPFIASQSECVLNSQSPATQHAPENGFDNSKLQCVSDGSLG